MVPQPLTRMSVLLLFATPWSTTRLPAAMQGVLRHSAAAKRACQAANGTPNRFVNQRIGAPPGAEMQSDEAFEASS